MKYTFLKSSLFTMLQGACVFLILTVTSSFLFAETPVPAVSATSSTTSSSASSNTETSQKPLQVLPEAMNPPSPEPAPSVYPIYLNKERDSHGRIHRLYGFINSKGKVVVEPQYEDVREPSEGMIVVYKKGLYGFVDYQGKEVIKPSYDSANSFKEGVSIVRKDQEHGVLDKEGHFTPVKGRILNDFSDGLCRVQVTLESPGPGKPRRTVYEYIDKKGTIVLKPEYAPAGEFKDGVARVGKDGDDLWHYIDKTGKTLFTLPMNVDSYDDHRDFSEGLIAQKENGWWGYQNIKGEWVIKAKYDSASDFKYSKAFVTIEGKHLTIDKQGNELPKPTYIQEKPFSEGYAVVTRLADGRLTYIDKYGQFPFRLPMLEKAESFSSGRALICIDKKYGYIDTSGNILISCQYPQAKSFKGELAEVGGEDGTLIYLNAQGKVVWKAEPIKWESAKLDPVTGPKPTSSSISSKKEAADKLKEGRLEDSDSEDESADTDEE